MNLDIDTGIELIKKAYEQRNEDLLMQRWMLHYQDEISFEEFKTRLEAGAVQDNRAVEEILLEVKGVLDTFNKAGDR